ALGYYFAGFYLLSTLFRPGVEYYKYLRSRLYELGNEVKYPREDVIKLRADVMELKSRVSRHEDQIQELEKQLGEQGYRLEMRVQQEAQAGVARHQELDRRFGSLGRKFEETVDRLTDNQEIIAGVKAFLRLVKDGSQEKHV